MGAGSSKGWRGGSRCLSQVRECSRLVATGPGQVGTWVHVLDRTLRVHMGAGMSRDEGDGAGAQGRGVQILGIGQPRIACGYVVTWVRG